MNSPESPLPAGPSKSGRLLWPVLGTGLVALAVFAAWKSGWFGGSPGSGGPLNVNTASVEELKALPDVDGKIAEDIVKKRPFKDVDDLLRVKGIGEKRLEKIRANVKVE